MKTKDKYKKSLSLYNATGTNGLGEASAKVWPRVLGVARGELNEKTSAEKGKALALEAWGNTLRLVAETLRRHRGTETTKDLEGFPGALA
ncbi:MAG: hypothetical protein ABSF46_32905 [Terriglobia bacterium]|jgi:hypothetical protein